MAVLGMATRASRLAALLLAVAAPSTSASGAEGTVWRDSDSVAGKQASPRAPDGKADLPIVGDGGQSGSSPTARIDFGPPEEARHEEQEGVGNAQGAPVSYQSDAPSALAITSSNGYPSVIWSPWSGQLAEPYRESLLRAESSVGDPDNDLFMWTIPEENGAVYEGREVLHTFKKVGRKHVILTQTIAATGEQYTLESYIMVKYVRRELRALTDEDREAFLNVMEILYRVPTAEGVKTYGSEYKGIDHFVQMHLDGAGTKECDHWHDDAGIMTHHVGYTLLFEQAMQLLEPSIAMPYWEYTIEASQDINYYGDSIVFDDDWFGEFNPQNDMHTVERGRFSYLPIQKNAWDYVHNSFGLLRTPWNLNGSPYVTRHNLTDNETPTHMVDCENYVLCFSSENLSSMHACLNGLTHGPVHIMIGGQWGNEEEEFIEKAGYYMLAPLLTKYLWRKGYLKLPEFCAPGEACVSSCPSEIYESRGMSVYGVLEDVHAQAWMALLTNGTLQYNPDEDKFQLAGHADDEAMQDAFWTKMLHSFCSPGDVGEMYTSAAPYDPLFWVVHPTSDRLLAWRRMIAREESGYDFDETWGYDHGFVTGETGVVCDWTGIDEDSHDLPKCVKGICGGHKEHDLLPFHVKIKGEKKQMTNAEWMDLIYPTNEDLPYMYDQFNWDHCSADGYDIGVSS